MTYEVVWTSAAQRSMNSRPTKISNAVVEFVHATLAENPHRVGKPLHMELEGVHTARRGDFRVLYKIDDERLAVEILSVWHRSDAYRRR